MASSETSVLIVGAGPVGMMGAILLKQLGIDVRLIERRSAPSTAPAAHVVNARTFEICRGAGVDMDAIAANTVDPVDGGKVVWWTNLAGEAVSTLPFEVQGDEALKYSPTPLRNMGQHRFERVLRDTIDKHGAAPIEWNCQWQSAVQDEGGVTSVVKNLRTGEVETIRSKFLIASDGAGSRVREAMGIAMDGPPKIRSFIMAHFEVDLREFVKDCPGILHWLLDPEQRAGGLIAHDIDREWVLMVPYDDESETLEDFDQERCVQLLHDAIGDVPSKPARLIQTSKWNMSAQVAQSFRSGRVFLAGDAAHRFPPAGGLGLNSGVQDVHGLAWRLAGVLDQWADISVLDSYEIERRRVAQNNSNQSLRNAKRVKMIQQAMGTEQDPSRARMKAALADPTQRSEVVAAIQAQAEHFDMLGLQLGYRYEDGAIVPDGSEPPTVLNSVREYVPTAMPGARLPHAWMERDGVRCSTLDAIEPGTFTLFTSHPSVEWESAASEISEVPITVISVGRDMHDLEGFWANVSELAPGGALLVRPDQHVCWRAKSRPDNPREALRTALDEILGNKHAHGRALHEKAFG